MVTTFAVTRRLVGELYATRLEVDGLGDVKEASMGETFKIGDRVRHAHGGLGAVEIADHRTPTGFLVQWDSGARQWHRESELFMHASAPTSAKPEPERALPQIATGPIHVAHPMCPCGSLTINRAVKTWAGVISGECDGCGKPVTFVIAGHTAADAAPVVTLPPETKVEHVAMPQLPTCPVPTCYGAPRRLRGETRIHTWRCGCAVVPERVEACYSDKYARPREKHRNAEVRQEWGWMAATGNVAGVHPLRTGAVAAWRVALGKAQQREDEEASKPTVTPKPRGIGGES